MTAFSLAYQFSMTTTQCLRMFCPPNDEIGKMFLLAICHSFRKGLNPRLKRHTFQMFSFLCQVFLRYFGNILRILMIYDYPWLETMPKLTIIVYYSIDRAPTIYFADRVHTNSTVTAP